MKTNFLPRNRPRSNGSKRVLALGTIFVFAVLVFSVFRGSIIRLAEPLWKADNAVAKSLGNTLKHFRTSSSLIKENNELKAKITDYEALIISARSIEKRNEELLGLVGRQAETGGKLAAVIAHPPETPYDILLVDIGRDQGISEGEKVESREGYALGTVSESYSSNARVSLYTLSGRKTDAVLERGSVPIILEGNGGGNFKAALPRDMTVVEGDRILLAGIEGKLVAVVGNIYLRPTDSYKEVLASTPENISNINEVFIR